MTWRTLHTISHSIMVHAGVSEACIHLTLMYTTYHIFPVLPIKHLINGDCEPTTIIKIATCTKPSVSHLHMLFCSCVVRNATEQVDKKALNMLHQVQKSFHSIFFGIPQHQKGYLFVRTRYKEYNTFI